jgi:hypothetical protein
MTLSHEGVMLLARGGLVAVMILLGAIFRTLYGPGWRRNRIALVGTVAGIGFGILIAAPLSAWLHTDVSAISASLGMFLGLAVGWRFARHIPREAH